MDSRSLAPWRAEAAAAGQANRAGRGAFHEGPGFVQPQPAACDREIEAGLTDNAPGGLAMINEGGRGEIVNLPSGAQVIPHDISMRMAAANGNDNSGVVAPVTIQIDATGADAAGLARVSQSASNSLGLRQNCRRGS
jgi:hypothetical protein